MQCISDDDPITKSWPLRTMISFNESNRSALAERMLAIANADSRVTGGAFVGSGATDTMDAWSDIDLTFGVRSGIVLEDVLHDWTEQLTSEFGMVHYFDVRSGSAIYRVILFPGGLELDVSVSPETDFGARSPQFRLLFGEAIERTTFPQQSIQELVGWGWHHILHANAAISRGRRWNAEFWISGLRDHIITLKSIRAGVTSAHARGAYLLPLSEQEDLERTLLRSLEEQELRRSFDGAIRIFMDEVKEIDEGLAEQLRRTFGLHSIGVP